MSRIKHADAFGRELKEALKFTGVGIGPDFYTAGYDSPWKMNDRTNEVMFEKIEDQAVWLILNNVVEGADIK